MFKISRIVVLLLVVLISALVVTPAFAGGQPPEPTPTPLTIPCEHGKSCEQHGNDNGKPETYEQTFNSVWIYEDGTMEISHSEYSGKTLTNNHQTMYFNSGEGSYTYEYVDREDYSGTWEYRSHTIITNDGDYKYHSTSSGTYGDHSYRYIYSGVNNQEHQYLYWYDGRRIK